MPGGIVRIPVVPDTRDFPRQLGDGLRSSAGVAGTAAKAIGLAVAGGIAVSAVGLGAAIKLGNEYAANLNQLQAVSGATGVEMARVGSVARELGSDLSLPATSGADAAAVMLELAKGGFTLQQSMDAARGTIQLAAAAQIDGAQAAEIQAAALNQFQLSAADASRVADVLANTSNAASGSIQDVALALKYVGPVANAIGISIEDTASAIGLLAQNGILADNAGTALRGMIASLSAPSKEAKGAIADLGVEAFDQQGKFVGLRTVIGQLTAAQARMTDEQFASAAATAFGREPLSAIVALASGGTAAFDSMADAVSRQGGAADVAAARTQGLGGALDKLKSQAEDAALGVYEAIEPTGERLVLALADATARAGDAVAKGLEAGIAAAEVYGPRIGEAISARANVVEDALREVFGPIVSGSVGLLNAGVNTAIGVWDDFTGVLDSAVDTARPIANGIRDLADSATEGDGAVSALATGVGLLGDAAGVAADLLEPVGTVVGGFVSAVAALPGPLQAAVLGLAAYKVASSALADSSALSGVRQFSGEMRVQTALAAANGESIGRLDAALAAYRTSQLPAVAAARSFTDVVADLRREAASAGQPISVVSGALGALAERSPTIAAMGSAYQRTFDVIARGSERVALGAGVAVESISQLGAVAATGMNRAALETEAAGRRISGIGALVQTGFNRAVLETERARDAVVSRVSAIGQAFTALPTAVGVAAINTTDRVRSMVSSVGDAVTSLPGKLAALPTAIGVGVVSALDRIPGAVTGAVDSLGRLGAVAGGVTAASVRGLASAASGLIGALGGPWGVAIAAAGIGLSLLAGHQADAAAKAKSHASAVDSLAAALRESNGQISEQVRLTVAQRFLGDEYTEAADAAKKLNVGIGDVTDAALNQGNALSSLRTQLEGIITANTSYQTTSTGAKSGAVEEVKVLNEQGQAAQALLNSINSLAGETDKAQQKQRELDRAVREGRASMLDGTSAGRDFSSAIKDLSDNTSSADDKARALKRALDALSGGGISLEAAQSQVAEQLDRLSAAFTTNGSAAELAALKAKGFGDSLLNADGSINKTLPNGRLLFQSLQDIATSSAEVATRTYEVARAQGDDVPTALAKAKAAVQSTRDALIAQHEQWGLTAEQVAKVLDRYGLVPDKIETLLQLNGTDKTLVELALVRERANAIPPGKTITVQTLSEEAKKKLEELGFKVLTTPNGVTITANSDKAKAELDRYIAENSNRQITVSIATRTGPVLNHDGNIVPAQRFALGGVAAARPFRAGVAQIFPPRVLRYTGDRTVDDEFYIPDNNDPRSMALGMEWLRRRGLAVVKAFATGGIEAATTLAQQRLAPVGTAPQINNYFQVPDAASAYEVGRVSSAQTAWTLRYSS